MLPFEALPQRLQRKIINSLENDKDKGQHHATATSGALKDREVDVRNQLRTNHIAIPGKCLP